MNYTQLGDAFYYDQYILAHHGIKGMKWGVRRFQREDGSRTSLGKKHRETVIDKALGVNAKYYSNKANKYKKRADVMSTMASMNRDAKDRSKSKVLKKIYQVNENYYTKLANKRRKKELKNSQYADIMLEALKRRRTGNN